MLLNIADDDKDYVPGGVPGEVGVTDYVTDDDADCVTGGVPGEVGGLGRGDLGAGAEPGRLRNSDQRLPKKPVRRLQKPGRLQNSDQRLPKPIRQLQRIKWLGEFEQV